MTNSRSSKGAAAAGAGIAALTLMAGCAGGISAGDSGEGGGGVGFEFGADQDEVSAAIADLEPVTLTFQPGGTSPDSIISYSAHAFMEAVEERSEGKIDFNVSWGRSIAGYTEIDDALADGRLDIAFAVPIYQPDEHPAFDALSKFTQFAPASPYVGEAVADAMMMELAWSSEEVMSEFEDKGLAVLRPQFGAGTFHVACNSPGSTLDDWSGKVVRAGNTTHTAMMEALGASPTFLEYEETYDALQRNTIACTTMNFTIVAPTGIMEAAPHLSYLTDSAIATTSTNAMLAGAAFNELPLAYQQIIFDAGADDFHGNLMNIYESAVKSIEDVEGAGGSIEAMDPEANEALLASQLELAEEIQESGLLGDDIIDRAAETGEKWATIAAEMGHEDGGDLSDFRDWYDDSFDMRELGLRVIAEAGLPHRPQ